MDSSITSSESPLHELSLFLLQKMRITLSDGRVIEGLFECMDKDMNFILGNATEFYGTSSINFASTEIKNVRLLGQVMVPGAHVVSCYIQRQNV